MIPHELLIDKSFSIYSPLQLLMWSMFVVVFGISHELNDGWPCFKLFQLTISEIKSNMYVCCLHHHNNLPGLQYILLPQSVHPLSPQEKSFTTHVNLSNIHHWSVETVSPTWYTNTHVAKGMPNVIVLHSQNYKVRRVDLSCNWSYKEIPGQISKHMNQLHNTQGNPDP